MEWWTDLREAVDRGCAGRNPWLRAPLVLLLCWAWMRHAADPVYRSLFGGLNLGVHELGHFVFGPFGDIPGALGGSLLQCLLPFAGMAMFLRQRDLFAIAFAWGWLGTNLFEVATYAGDAVAMRLPLVTPGGGHPIHDWNYVLGAMGWLRHTESLEAALRASAHGCMALATGGGAWLLARMITWRGAAAPGGVEMPKGGGPAACPRVPLRPWSEPQPPWITAPVEPSATLRPSRGDARSPEPSPTPRSPVPAPPSSSASPARPHSTRDR